MLKIQKSRRAKGQGPSDGDEQPLKSGEIEEDQGNVLVATQSDDSTNLADAEEILEAKSFGIEEPEQIQIEEKKESRRKAIAGNWKMYKTIDESVAYVNELIPLIKEAAADVMLAVPFTAIRSVANASENSKLIVGAQNMNDASEGAFTGEIAARMLLEAGASFVILGHSERRHVFHEDDSFINKKVRRALADGLKVILCIGETLEQHELGAAENVLAEQLQNSLQDIALQTNEELIIAYEPVWAIGTGLTATPALANQTQAFIRQHLASVYSDDIANGMKILYGGSVKPDNAEQLLSEEHIDGLLVGGASLTAQSFAQIIAACK